MKDTSSLHFHSLSILFQKDSAIIGRIGTGTYAEFPFEGVALLQLMQKGLSPHLAAEWYEQEYGETIDIEDFLNTLQELDFLADNKQKEIKKTSYKNSFFPYWSFIGRVLFSPVAWICYTGLFALCIYTIIRMPRLFPNYQNIYFSHYYILVELGLVLGQIPGVLFHEMFHMLAMSRLGLHSRLSIGYRLQYLVIETDLTDLWSVPRKYRYLPYLAGMLADAIFFSFLIIISSIALHSSNFTLFGYLCLANSFLTFMRFIWQFSFYMRTDIYYVFSNLFGCINLHSVTKAYINNRFFRLLRQDHKLSNEAIWSLRDYQVALWYAPFYLIGYIITLGFFFFVMLPIILQVSYQVTLNLFVYHKFLAISFWDSIAFLFVNLLPLILIAVTLLRSKQKT